MKYQWLNKQRNKNLIVFLAGWSFDCEPFKFLKYNNHDVLFMYDYNDFEIPPELKTSFTNYENKILITWSMGVFVGYLLKDIFKDFNYKIAINGTITPVDNLYGIPVKIFELTLKHAKTGLEGKFYKNIFLTDDEFQKYLKAPVKRTIENRVSELESLYNKIKFSELDETSFYDFAVVSKYDNIIPSDNQIASHTKNNLKFKTVDLGHSIFYNFNSWCDIIDLCK